MSERGDEMLELIHANRDSMLKMAEEALRRVRLLLERSGPVEYVPLALEVIRAYGLFHPMHGESWQGWPEGS